MGHYAFPSQGLRGIERGSLGRLHTSLPLLPANAVLASQYQSLRAPELSPLPHHCPLEAPKSLGDQWLPKNLSLLVAHRQCPKCRISPLFSILATLTCSLLHFFRTLLNPKGECLDTQIPPGMLRRPVEPSCLGLLCLQCSGDNTFFFLCSSKMCLKK